MNTTITENNENVRQVNVDKLLEDVLSFEKGKSPKSAYEMGNIYNLPIKKRNNANTFSQRPVRKNKPKAFGKLPNFTRKNGGKRSKRTRANKRR
jgi:hypothetical protein